MADTKVTSVHHDSQRGRKNIILKAFRHYELLVFFNIQFAHNRLLHRRHKLTDTQKGEGYFKTPADKQSQ